MLIGADVTCLLGLRLILVAMAPSIAGWKAAVSVSSTSVLSVMVRPRLHRVQSKNILPFAALITDPLM